MEYLNQAITFALGAGALLVVAAAALLGASLHLGGVPVLELASFHCIVTAVPVVLLAMFGNGIGAALEERSR
jgi:hypothetical protein